jgi:hypothetical protein
MSHYNTIGIKRPHRFGNMITTETGGRIVSGGRIQLNKHHTPTGGVGLCNGYPVDYPPGRIHGTLTMSNGGVNIDGVDYTVIDGMWRAPGYRSATRRDSPAVQKRERDDRDDDATSSGSLSSSSSSSNRNDNGSDLARAQREAARAIRSSARERERVRRQATIDRVMARRDAKRARRDVSRDAEAAIAQISAVMLAARHDRHPVRTSSTTATTTTTTASFSLLALEGHAEKSDVESVQCSVCLENKKNVLFQPCRHICLCVDCARSLHEKPECPMCRARITGAEVVFI